ncbi:MAG: hypothetical protein LBI04_02885 [Treponema sp.]|jgi:hypothetical protein|nr:hypothetical protein [Treponema sp.]
MIKESRTSARWILLLSFTISLITLIIYLTETALSDEELFLLLALLRYSSFTVCVSSVFFFITGIISLFKNFSVNLVLQVIFSILGILYGSGIIIVDAFLDVITRGQ